MKIRTIEWQNNKIKIIDQTKLPLKLEYIYLKDTRSLHAAIKEMKMGVPRNSFRVLEMLASLPVS